MRRSFSAVFEAQGRPPVSPIPDNLLNNRFAAPPAPRAVMLNNAGGGPMAPHQNMIAGGGAEAGGSAGFRVSGLEGIGDLGDALPAPADTATAAAAVPAPDVAAPAIPGPRMDETLVREYVQKGVGNIYSRLSQVLAEQGRIFHGMSNTATLSNNGTLPVVGSPSFSKATVPSKIDKALIQAIRNGQGNAQSLSMRLSAILRYEKRKSDLDYPLSALGLITDIESSIFLEAAFMDLSRKQDQERALHGSNRTLWTTADLVDIPRDSASPHRELNLAEVNILTTFAQYIMGEVRSNSDIALDDLHEGAIKQGKDERTARYAQRFMTKARELLGTESQASLCRLYLAGLKSGLQERCMLTTDNKRWNDLHALQQFSYGEEERYNIALGRKSRVTSAGTRMQQGDFAEGGPRPAWKGFVDNGGRKRSRYSGGGAAAVVAAAAAMETDDANVDYGFVNVVTKKPAWNRGNGAGAASGGNGGAGSGGGGVATGAPSYIKSTPYKPEITTYGADCGAYSGTPRGVILRNSHFQRPESECPAYIPEGKIIPKSNLWTDDQLAQYGLCNACRRGRHISAACPNQAGGARGGHATGGRGNRFPGSH